VLANTDAGLKAVKSASAAGRIAIRSTAFHAAISHNRRANVTVLKGVTIGSGSVIGLGSIVTKSIPSGVVAAGSPARVLRKIILDRQAIRR